MKLLVVGLGSMGKRRIRLLKQYFDEVEVFGIDLSIERRDIVEKEFNVKTFASIQDAKNNLKLDGVIICTSPLSHHKIIMECINYNLNVFTEINLVADSYDEIIKLAKEKNVTLFLSSTMLYRKEIDYISTKVKQSRNKVNYIYHIGQYLPDWHPWENYKDFFVNEKRSNGCREILAIEMPWIYKVFGKITNIKVNKSNSSSLELNYYDTYQILLTHDNGSLGMLSIDVVSRKAIRNLEVFGEDIHVFWKGTPQSLSEYDIETKKENNIETYMKVDKNNNYSENIIENAYLDELKTFIDKIKGTNNEKYTFEDDKYVLSILDQIEGV
ncbi:Gfo/Idh/MocA family protein [Clostridium cellulovorans]|uniref:Oxidoreductase domain protein n=1 Tax=Clostridium cellulovorans (strain ATCC 35296 / DSM 3052 / OCM 3 / 743B) TaxID=573061 RepID=D9SNX2_CLOC7|nr:Gfo/Idh/MocA family oxidoreductase [Clostridium cellulovorans]ADL51937.1 oxidoreductase domain protein [Clostridium cellulovorans 743B]